MKVPPLSGYCPPRRFTERARHLALLAHLRRPAATQRRTETICLTGLCLLLAAAAAIAKW
jgi:hypothetical protein